MGRQQLFFRGISAAKFTMVLALLATVGTASAQLPELGDETLVNANSTQNESEASVAMDAIGNYAVSFTRHDGTNNGIGIQRYLRNGTVNGSVIVPPTGSGAPVQQDSSLAMANDGRFVVVWEDNGNRNGINSDVKYALFSATGSPVVSGIVNTILSGVRENPRVAMNRETGDFVVVFAGGTNQSNVDVYYRRFSATGAALDTTEQMVNSAGPGRTSLPSVALASNGRFIVAWEGDVSGDDMWEAYFQRYDFGTTSATPQGTNTVATQAGHDTTNVDVACDESGNFVLAWVDGLAFSSTEAHDLLYRIYDSAGTAAGNPQQLKAGAFSGNGDTNIARIRLAMEDDRDFVATYLHNDEIYARFLNAAGTQQGSEIHVNTTTNSDSGEFQSDPWVAMNPSGNRATIVWNGTGVTDSNGVHMQRYASPNVAPELAAIGNQSTSELQALTFTAAATDANFGDTIMYSLSGTPPAGSSIDASTGEFTWTPTEAQGPGTYNVTVRAQDDGEPAMADTETITIEVAEANVAPTDLQLSNSNVQSASPAGTVVGTFTASDSDEPAQTMTYSLISGTGDTDNASFTIVGDQLQVAVPPDNHVKPVMSINVQAEDGFGGTVDRVFVITVQPAAAVDEWLLY